jgi:hypothetical protein
MSHVWYDSLGNAHSSRIASDAIDAALRVVERAVDVVDAVAEHERFVELERLSRERLDAVLNDFREEMKQEI